MPAPVHRRPHRVSWNIVLGAALVVLFAKPAWSVTYLSGSATLDRGGETYVVNQNFSASGTALTITAANVVLDLGGHTVTYGTGGAADCYGVNIKGINAEIKNGTLTQAAGNDAIHCHAICSSWVSNVAGPIIHDLTINTHSAGSRGVYLVGGGVGLRIYGCVFNTSNTVVSLDDEGCPAIQLWGPSYGSAAAHALIHHNTINGAQRGINLVGQEPVDPERSPRYVDIYSNQIHPLAPATNAKVSTGIHLFGSSHCRIFDNVISTSHGRGIKLQYHSDYNEVYGNTIDVSDDQPDYYNNVYGIRLRHGPSYNKIHHNTVVCRSVNTANNQALVCFQLGDEQAVADSGVPYGNEIYSNTFDCRWNRDMDGARVCVEIAHIGTGNSFHDNTLISNTWPVEFRDPSIGPLEFRANTIRMGSAPNEAWDTVMLWGDAGPAGPHRLIDTVCGPGVSLTDAHWGKNGGSYDVEWSLTAAVMDGKGAAISGATVTIQDKTGATVYTGTTDGAGKAVAALREYTNATGGKTYYTPHTVKATKAGYTDATATVTVDATKQVTLTLGGGSRADISIQATPLAVAPLVYYDNPSEGVVTFTIAYSNDTGATMYNAVVRSAIQSAMTYVPGSAKLNGQTITPDPYQNGSLVISLGNLAAGASGTITFQATVN
jgi:uncharacterized repeat protein (TIGR01451 family)